MKIKANEQATLDSRGQMILMGNIEEVNLTLLQATIWQGIKFMEDEIGNTESELRKDLLSCRVNEAREIHKKLLTAISGIVKEFNNEK